MVVAGVALVVNVDASVFELLNKGVNVSNRHYAVVGSCCHKERNLAWINLTKILSWE